MAPGFWSAHTGTSRAVVRAFRSYAVRGRLGSRTPAGPESRTAASRVGRYIRPFPRTNRSENLRMIERQTELALSGVEGS